MNHRFIFLLLGTILLFSACRKDEVTFVTEVVTTDVTSIVDNTATSGGEIISEGSPTIQECGVEYCVTDSFNNNVQKVLVDKPQLGLFTCVMTNLQQRTTYFVRAYAKNTYGVIYGKTLSFTTPAIPIVKTADIKYETGASFITGGEVIDDGDSTILARGVCWGTDSLLTINNDHTSDGKGIGKFESVIEDLLLGTKYYVRAYAQNAAGVGYGEIKSVTTASVAATVTTNNVTNITSTAATCGGNVTSDGGATVTERGVCYSTSQNPTTSNTKVTSGSGTGSFTCNLSGLSMGTTYYVRAYAVNNKGTAYGEQKTFTTASVVATVTTNTVTNITSTSATCGGNVTSDGGAIVTERGVCYSTSQNPTTSNTKVTSGSGTGSFTCDLTGLSIATTYYVRAYAVNNKGTAYGEQKTFKTSNTLPADFLSFKSNQNGSTIGLARLASGQTIEYSTNGTTWNSLTQGSTVTLNAGQSIYVRGILSSNNSSSNYSQFTMSGSIEANGNLSYLWNYENPSASLKQYCGTCLFLGCSALTKAPSLPATTLAEYCYSFMFSDCLNLKKAPSLPVTTLATSCYDGMFNNCTSLTTAPELPATTLAESCYSFMFTGCSNLEKAPSLPATILAYGCYNLMFAGCTSLNYIKCLAIDISASYCTEFWVSGVSSTGTFIKVASMTGWTTGVKGIPSGWTVINE